MNTDGWQRACPKCLNDDVEKVGWGYWYCNDCGDIWEVIAEAGKPPACLEPGLSSAKPDPGLLSPIIDPDYPL